MDTMRVTLHPFDATGPTYGPFDVLRFTYTPLQFSAETAPGRWVSQNLPSRLYALHCEPLSARDRISREQLAGMGL